MNKDKFDKLIEFSYTGGRLFQPMNQKAHDICDMAKIGEKIYFHSATERDVKFHQCYFVLLYFIWQYLPDNFHKKVKREKFYSWLKHLKKEYSIVYSFKDRDKQEDIAAFCFDLGISVENAAKLAEKFGYTDMIEYESISFGRMSQETFKNYIREQLPWIYENVLGVYYKGDKYNNIIDTIEHEFEKFLSKL